jgi:hypothetical protein
MRQPDAPKTLHDLTKYLSLFMMRGNPRRSGGCETPQGQEEVGTPINFRLMTTGIVALMSYQLVREAALLRGKENVLSPNLIPDGGRICKP